MPDRGEPYRTILIFGAPGVGKGTQGKILGEIPGFYHLACGDVFRSLDPNSELGKTFLAYSSQGKLVPDEFTVRLWRDRIQGLVQTGGFRPAGEILVLDGIPRNRNQAELMADYIDVMMLIFMEVADEEELVARVRRRALHENRLDDTSEAVIRRRLREYEAETAPLLDYYPDHLIHRVDAGKKPIGVLQRVIEAIQGTPVGRAL